MTSERAQAYGRVMRALEELADSKLHVAEQERVREAADTLLFSEDVDRRDVREAVEAVEALARDLVESERFTPERARALVDDVLACGPVAAALA